jgi:hypothetical protein
MALSGKLQEKVLVEILKRADCTAGDQALLGASGTKLESAWRENPFAII